MLRQSCLRFFNLGHGLSVATSTTASATKTPSRPRAVTAPKQPDVLATTTTTNALEISRLSNAAAVDATTNSIRDLVQRQFVPMTKELSRRLNTIDHSRRTTGSRNLQALTMSDAVTALRSLAFVNRAIVAASNLTSTSTSKLSRIQFRVLQRQVRLLRRLERRVRDISNTADSSQQLSSAFLALHQITQFSRGALAVKPHTYSSLARSWMHLMLMSTTNTAVVFEPTPADAAKTLYVLGSVRMPFKRFPSTTRLVHKLFQSLLVLRPESSLPVLKPGAAASILQCAAHYRLSGDIAERAATQLLNADHILQLPLAKCAGLIEALRMWQDPPPSCSNLIQALVFKVTATVPQSAEEETMVLSCLAAFAAAPRGNSQLLQQQQHEEQDRLFAGLAEAALPILLQESSLITANAQHKQAKAVAGLKLARSLNQRKKQRLTAGLPASDFEGNSQARATILRSIAPLAKRSAAALDIAVQFAVDFVQVESQRQQQQQQQQQQETTSALTVGNEQDSLQILCSQLARFAAKRCVSTETALRPSTLANTLVLLHTTQQHSFLTDEVKERLFSLFVTSIATFTPGQYSAASEAIFSFHGEKVDAVSLDRTASVLLEPSFLRRISASDAVAIARGWAIIAAVPHSDARPDQLAVQHFYSHVVHLAPRLRDVALIGEMMNAMRDIGCLTPRLFVALTQSMRDTVCGDEFAARWAGANDLLSSGDIDGASTPPQKFSLLSELKQLSSEHTAILPTLLNTFREVAVEYTISSYKGADSFRETWLTLRDFVIENAFKFDATSLVAAANAFAVLNTADRAVFGVLARRAEELLRMSMPPVVSQLLATQLEGAAAAALLLRCHHPRSQHDLAAALLFNISRVAATAWYPLDAIVALDALVRYFSSVFDNNNVNASKKDKDDAGSTLVPAIVIESWHRAFDNVRTAIVLMFPETEEEQRQQLIPKLDAALHLHFVSHVDPRVVISAATALAASSLSDALLERIAIALLTETVLPRADADGVVDALACCVELTDSSRSCNFSFEERVRLIAPFAVRVPRVAQRILKSSSVALAAHSLHAAGVLEDATLRELAKAAMRLFP